MTKVLVTDSSLGDIGDAIRDRNGQSTQYLVSEMPAAIRSLDLDEVIYCHVVGGTEYAAGWLSDEAGGTALTPQEEKLYVIVSSSHENEMYRWDGTSYVSILVVYGTATQSANGLMSASDKAKLDGIASGATANTSSSSAPRADGVASAGSSASYARGDHVHPTDTSRAANSDVTSMAKEKASYHLGFYVDQDGDVCQA